MSKRDPETSLRQILDHAREAVAITEDKTRTDLDQDRLLNLALTRLIEIIGEAASRVPEEIQGSTTLWEGWHEQMAEGLALQEES